MYTALLKKAILAGAVLSVLSPSTPLIAQDSTPGDVFHSPEPDDTPGIDSPVIYRAFFYQQDALRSWMDSQRAANPDENQRVLQGAARRYRIQEAELPKLVEVSRSAVANLKQVETESRDVLAFAKSQSAAADGASLQQQEQRRQKILTSAIEELRASLSPDSWRGLRSYLNDEFRKRIHSVPTEKR